MRDLYKPWYNQMPFSNFGQFNLDWIISKWGEYDQRLKVVEEKNEEQDERLDTCEADINNLQDRMETAEADIDALEGRMDTAEGDISDLKDRMTTAEGDIDSLEGRMDTAEGKISALEDNQSSDHSDISDLKNRMNTAEGEINTINLENQSQDNDITALDGRVTILEGSKVTANPGGSGQQLNTLQVGSTVYSVPSGGGGGGGSSVTPNPAGAVTGGDLVKIDIDGTIYGIPAGVDTSGLISDAYDSTATYNTGDFCIYNNTLYKCIEDSVTGTWDSSKWTATKVTSELEDVLTEVDTKINSVNSNVVLADTHSGSMTANGSVQEITGTSFTFPSEGTYLITATAEYDTSNYGSAARYLGFYLRDSDTNIALDKFVVNGNEPAMITQAADMALSKVLRIGTSDLSETFRLCARVSSATNKTFSYSTYLSVVKLSDAIV